MGEEAVMGEEARMGEARMGEEARMGGARAACGEAPRMDGTLSAAEQAAWSSFLLMQGTLMRQLDADLRRASGLSHAEFEVLLRLSWAPDRRLRLSDLCAASLLTLSGMSRLVDRLARVGLVAKAGATEDRRGAYAVLTDRGLAHLHAAAVAHHGDVRRRFLSLYNDRELMDLACLLRRFTDHQQDMTDPCADHSPTLE